MTRTFLEEQLLEAKNNYNYFIMQMISQIIYALFKLSIVLLISSIFNYIIINIIALILTFYTLYKIYQIIDNYLFIINDIRTTLNIKELTFEIDLTLIKNTFLKKLVNYGK